jgi:hypothetical protein
MSVVLKGIEVLLFVIMTMVVIYFVLIALVGFISWSFGIQPVHLLPGMTLPSEWRY